MKGTRPQKDTVQKANVFLWQCKQEQDCICVYTARNNWNINITSNAEQNGKEHLSVRSALDYIKLDF